MDNYDAVMLAEGVMEPRDESHLLEAWQHLVDTGMACRMHVWFGLTAQSMIDAGLLSQNKDSKETSYA
jgi:hypothetical protein